MDSAKPRVKICGITRPTDAELAIELGAWALGLMFYPKSSRALSADQAERLVDAIGDHRNKTALVGVFVNEDLATIAELSRRLGLDYVQLHGDETPGVLAELAERLNDHGNGPKLIKALRTGPGSQLAETDIAAYRRLCPLLLIDSYSAKAYGGTGQTADWAEAKLLCAKGPTLLAGGITPDNVGEALTTVSPWGIDLSSGVEQSPGIKDHGKLRQLFAALPSTVTPAPAEGR